MTRVEYSAYCPQSGRSRVKFIFGGCGGRALREPPKITPRAAQLFGPQAAARTTCRAALSRYFMLSAAVGQRRTARLKEPQYSHAPASPAAEAISDEGRPQPSPRGGPQLFANAHTTPSAGCRPERLSLYAAVKFGTMERLAGMGLRSVAKWENRRMRMVRFKGHRRFMLKWEV